MFISSFVIFKKQIFNLKVLLTVFTGDWPLIGSSIPRTAELSSIITIIAQSKYLD